MSLEATTWAFGVKAGGGTRKLLLLGMANHAHKNGRNSWASKETLGEYAECDARTVARQIKYLLAAGLIRRGDQTQVAHLRADRRPVVYDLAMNEETQVRWAAEAASPTPAAAADEPHPTHQTREDRLSPRSEGDGVTQSCPPATGNGVTHGVTPRASRGDTAVSPEPSTNPGTNPPTPVPGEPSCTKPGPAPHPNCRGCGTTNRQLRRAADRAAAEQRRAEHAAAAATDRARRPDPTDPAAVAARAAARRELQAAR